MIDTLFSLKSKAIKTLKIVNAAIEVLHTYTAMFSPMLFLYFIVIFSHVIYFEWGVRSSVVFWGCLVDGVKLKFFSVGALHINIEESTWD